MSSFHLALPLSLGPEAATFNWQTRAPGSERLNNFSQVTQPASVSVRNGPWAGCGTGHRAWGHTVRASWATGAIRVRGDMLAGVPRMVLSSQRRPTMGFTPNIRVALHLSYFQALVAPTAHGQGTLELQRFRVKAHCGPGSGWWVSGKQTLTVQRVLCSFHNLPSGQCLWLFIQLS